MAKPTYPTLRMLTMAGGFVLAVCVLALTAAHKPADAAFPGKNGKILFSGAPCGEDWPERIGSVNPDDTGYKMLTDDSCDEYGVPGDVDPEASPDGKKVAFTRWNETVLDIFVMNADGSEPKNLTDDALGNFDPAWSPDGKEIAFTSGRGGSEGDVYVVNADGTGEPRRIIARPGGEFSLAWSPDGSDLLYVSSADTPAFPNPGRDAEIYAMNPDGSGVSRLTDNTANDSRPDWSPNGNTIVFSSDRDGGKTRSTP